MKNKNNFIGLFLLPLFILATFLNTSAQERYVRPLDGGKTNASFNAFRNKLIEAINKRDKNCVISILDRNITNSFGGTGGINEFKKMWKINDPKSDLWDELLTVLTNGGAFYKEAESKGIFCAPYSFMAFPEDLDSFEYLVIFGNNVNLREKPNTSAKVVSQLSYNIVKVDYQNSIQNKTKENEYIWLKIETLGGKKGYVSADFVRSPIDYRACFEKKNGQWKMTVFVAGD